MTILRLISIVATQVPLLYFEAGSRDLLGGFNQTDAGFSLMVTLFVLVPFLDLSWLILESRRAWRRTRDRGLNRSLLLPPVALLFFFEALAIDLYILSHARM